MLAWDQVGQEGIYIGEFVMWTSINLEKHAERLFMYLYDEYGQVIKCLGVYGVKNKEGAIKDGRAMAKRWGLSFLIED